MTIERIIDKRSHDLGGGFVVGRVLPFNARRMVGPFIFFDHLGPLELAPGIPRELDVRPHPHIGLSTVTYLYQGQITHRDSLGFHQEIRSGEVNWMVAGSGITHSERLEYARAHGAKDRRGPHPFLDGRLRVAFVEDLDGHPIQLVQRVG